jgi:hypothetical protein
MQIDINTMQELLVAGAWIVPVITGLIQVIRVASGNAIYERFLPLLSLVIGAVLGGLVIGWSVIGILAGVIFGLAASGFYDLGKKTVAGK